jgi:hypothetical protein
MNDNSRDHNSIDNPQNPTPAEITVVSDMNSADRLNDRIGGLVRQGVSALPSLKSGSVNFAKHKGSKPRLHIGHQGVIGWAYNS